MKRLIAVIAIICHLCLLPNVAQAQVDMECVSSGPIIASSSWPPYTDIDVFTGATIEINIDAVFELGVMHIALRNAGYTETKGDLFMTWEGPPEVMQFFYWSLDPTSFATVTICNPHQNTEVPLCPDTNQYAITPGLSRTITIPNGYAVRAGQRPGGIQLAGAELPVWPAVNYIFVPGDVTFTNAGAQSSALIYCFFEHNPPPTTTQTPTQPAETPTMPVGCVSVSSVAFYGSNLGSGYGINWQQIPWVEPRTYANTSWFAADQHIYYGNSPNMSIRFTSGSPPGIIQIVSGDSWTSYPATAGNWVALPAAIYGMVSGQTPFSADVCPGSIVATPTVTPTAAPPTPITIEDGCYRVANNSKVDWSLLPEFAQYSTRTEYTGAFTLSYNGYLENVPFQWSFRGADARFDTKPQRDSYGWSHPESSGEWITVTELGLALGAGNGPVDICPFARGLLPTAAATETPRPTWTTRPTFTPSPTRTPTVTPSPTNTPTATSSPTITPSPIATPERPQCPVADVINVPVAPGTAVVSLQTGSRFAVAGAAVWFNVGSSPREILAGNYEWDLPGGDFTAYSLTSPATIWVCVSVAATSTPTAPPTIAVTCDTCLSLDPIALPPTVGGALPQLGIALPTLRPATGVTVTIVVSTTAIVQALATLEAGIETPAAAIATAGARYNYGSGAALGATVEASMQPATSWLALANPMHPQWEASGGPLWALAPFLRPISPILAALTLVVVWQVILVIARLVLIIADWIVKLIELIPGE